MVSRGDGFVFAQVLQHVVDFLGLDDDTGPTLSPTELAERYLGALITAIRLTRQMPNERLDDELPNRPRSWRVLMHHIYQVPNAFLDMEDSGQTLTYESLVSPPPPALRTSADIAGFGEQLQDRFASWWTRVQSEDFAVAVPTYFGEASRHEVLERTVWHSMQHMRQLASLLERAGVLPDRPLSLRDIEGLPLTEQIWD